MAHSNSFRPQNELTKLVSKKYTSSAIEVPIEFEHSGTRECVVCTQKSLETYEIHATSTISSHTSIHTFLSKYTHEGHNFTSEVNKYICNTCLQLVNVLEHAEIQYLKLKSTFEAVISKNPLFRKTDVVCKEEVTEQAADYDDTGPNSEDEEAMVSSVEVKVERDSDDEDDNYGGLENFVDTVMEPDPMDDDNSVPEDATPHELQDTMKTEPTNQDTDGPFECQTCHRSFLQKYRLIEHEIIHTDKKHYQCDLCDRIYNRKGYLQIHIERYHSDIKGHQCDHCSETFIDLTELRNHIKKHIGEPYKCDTCNCEFKRRDNYLRHLKTHLLEKDRPHECPLCKKRFVQRPHLRNHLATHTGEKPFVCTVCQCWFNRKGNLQRHMRTHTGEKPYECKACHQRFAQKLHLDTHFRRKHTPKLGDNPKQNRGKKKQNCKVSPTVNGLQNENKLLIKTEDN